MGTKYRFFAGVAIIHLIFGFLTLQLAKIDAFLFTAGEILLVISFLFAIRLYKTINQPFKVIASSIDSLKEKDFNSTILNVGHKEMDRLIDVYNHMINRLREEHRQQFEKNYFLDKLMQASPVGIIVLNAEDKIGTINSSACKMLDLAENRVKGVLLMDINNKLASQLLSLKDGIAQTFTVNGVMYYKCQKAHFIDQGYSHYFIMIEELTNEVYKKEKNAYDKIIRLISHEINNSTGAINSILNVLLSHEDRISPLYRSDYKGALNIVINRNIALSNVMSNFAKVVKISEPIKKKFDMHIVLRSVQLLMETFGKDKNIDWIWNLHNGPLYVIMDVDQMEQVLINIIKNSLEAACADKTSKIIISTSLNPFGLSIKDNGIGFSNEVYQRLFSPFFSTKKNGQGVGLTLAKEILMNHNFKFSLDCKEAWTEFKIHFNTAAN